MKPTVLTEQIDLSEAVIDTDGHVLKGVVLIRAGESKNKRDYPANVLAESVSIFEGVRAFADHPTRDGMRSQPERSVRDITGWYENVRFEDNALRADRRFVKTQAGLDAWALAEMVTSGKAPKGLAGLSINAVGRARKRDDGGVIVEAITHANSVDDVTTPAAGGGYVESAPSDLTGALLEAMTFEEWFESRPEFIKRVQNEMKTARQDKALTDAQALAERLQSELKEAQAQRDDAEAQRVAAVAELAIERRKVAIKDALAEVKLPARWKQSLFETLSAAEPAAWSGIIRVEVEKARSAGGQQRVEVTGAGQQIATAPVVESTRSSLLPLPDEDAEQFANRLRQMRRV